MGNNMGDIKIVTSLTRLLGIDYPIIGGAMYPCSNPELVAAVSEAGGIGVVQPISLTYVHGYELREGLRTIRKLTQKPIGFNVVVEKNSRIYEERMRRWLEVALEEGIRFFVTSLGNPEWVVKKAKPVGGIVFHDVTERRWAEKVIPTGIDGLIAVNQRAGGHAGAEAPEQLFGELQSLGLPLICAGGIGNETDFARALDIGYAGVQIGTRFIATPECNSHDDYKQAIVKATSQDIVLTERVTGVPLSVIRTPYVDRVGLKVGPLSRLLFKNRRTRHWIRMAYNLRALIAMKRSSQRGISTRDYYQAGHSVDGICKIEPVKQVIDRFVSFYASPFPKIGPKPSA